MTNDISYHRVRNLKLNGYTIKTPILWFGTPIFGIPKPWTFQDKFEGLLVNAYEIYTSNRIKALLEQKTLKEIISFDGPILMDSGGFFFQKKSKMTVKPKSIVEIYEKTKPEIVVSLDYPLNPNLTANSDYYRLNKTLKNLREMSDLLSSFDAEFMPVVHGYTIKQLERSIKTIQPYTDKMIGIGSLVPLFRSTNGTKNVPRTGARINPKIYAMKAIKKVRDSFPDQFLHVFGVGGATTMHLMYLLGVDSIDSMAWRLKAAFGAIQLPGTPDRFLSPRKKRTLISKKELIEFNKCRCPIHKNSIKEIDNSFSLRAIHNSYVLKEEVDKLQKKIEDNSDIIEFYKKRFKTSTLGKVSDFALELVNN